MNAGLSLLGLVDRPADGPLALDTGFAGRPRLLAVAGLAAAVCDVRLDDWVGPEAEARLADAAWIRDRAIEHEAAVRRIDDALHAASGTGLLPAGFGSIFSGPAALAALIDAHRGPIDAFFDEARGAREWALRLLADVEAVARTRTDTTRTRDETAPGAAYLARRHSEDRRADTVLADLTRIGDHAIDRLAFAPGVHAIAERASIAERADGLTTLHHAGVLVDEAERPDFDRTLDAIGAEVEPDGIVIELTGPWPAWSFAPRLGRTADAEAA